MLLKKILVPALIIAMLCSLAPVLGANIITVTEPRSKTIEVSAITQKSPAQIKLVWPANPSFVGDAELNKYQIYRKFLSDNIWTEIADLPGEAVSYTDTNISIGTAYEYKISKGDTINSYLYSGIEVPLVENRGKLIFIVDSTYATSLSTELATLQQDLVGDGWEVIRHDVSKDLKDTQVKKLIKADYSVDRLNVKGVFLFGHVAVPYSGLINPDGHPEHLGAWPADAYYGDMDGVWTDTTVKDTSGSNGANWNVPGDGKFDQSTLPSDVELFVGRVDLSGMSSSIFGSELQLMRQYLNKDHNFRNKLIIAEPRGLIRDNFYKAEEPFSTSGWRNFSAFFGSENIDITDDFIKTLATKSYLWAYGCGPGSTNYADGVASTNDYASTDTKAIFTILFGSYFGDWNTTDCFLKGPLISKTYGLVSIWSGRPQWLLQHMALGETVGFDTKISQNAGEGGIYDIKGSNNYRGVNISLLGDPTLRMLVVAPPANLIVGKYNGDVTLRWSASSDSIVGYNVYRASSSNGPFTKINTELVNGLDYADKGLAEGNYTYMVRAIKLETGGSGSYYNASTGIFCDVSNNSTLAELTPTPSPLPTSTPLATPTPTIKPTPKPTPVSYKDGSKIVLKINKSTQKLISPPVYVGKTILVPAASYSKLIKATYKWDAKTKQITVTKNKKTIVFKVGDSYAKINGIRVKMITTPLLIKSLPYIPIQFATEKIGAVYKYNDTNKTITITIKL